VSARTLDERINSRQASLARLLRMRVAETIRAAYPGATTLWIGEPVIGSVTIERISGPAREVRWDSAQDLGRKPYGSRPIPCPSEVSWSALGDVRLLLACLPLETPRTKDGYAIVRLPKTVAGNA
jgi:hypothetical protein